MAAKSDVGTEKKKPRPKSTHPTYLEMATEAIKSLDERKGASVPAIASFIAGKYSLDTEVVRVHLKPALAKGLEKGTLARPKNSDAKGFTGRFKVDKAKALEEEKAKKLKEKMKQAKEKAAEKKVAAKKPKPAAKKKTDKPKKKTPTKSPKKKVVEKKPKAAKAQLKTPKKTAKSLKTARKSTPKKK
ncbi:Domain in histone families 1 and 5 [Mactra antiquata]